MASTSPENSPCCRREISSLVKDRKTSSLQMGFFFTGILHLRAQPCFLSCAIMTPLGSEASSLPCTSTDVTALPLTPGCSRTERGARAGQEPFLSPEGSGG